MTFFELFLEIGILRIGQTGKNQHKDFNAYNVRYLHSQMNRQMAWQRMIGPVIAGAKAENTWLPLIHSRVTAVSGRVANPLALGQMVQI